MGSGVYEWRNGTFVTSAAGKQVPGLNLDSRARIPSQSGLCASTATSSRSRTSQRHEIRGKPHQSQTQHVLVWCVRSDNPRRTHGALWSHDAHLHYLNFTWQENHRLSHTDATAVPHFYEALECKKKITASELVAPEIWRGAIFRGRIRFSTPAPLVRASLVDDEQGRLEVKAGTASSVKINWNFRRSAYMGSVSTFYHTALEVPIEANACQRAADRQGEVRDTEYR